MHKAVGVCNCYTNEEFVCNLHVAGYASYKSSQEKTAVVLTVKKWTLCINSKWSQLAMTLASCAGLKLYQTCFAINIYVSNSADCSIR